MSPGSFPSQSYSDFAGTHTEGTFRGAGDIEIFWQGWLPPSPAQSGPEALPPRTVLLVHGLGEHSGRYANVINHLVPKGYAIFALDHRGHGRSGGKRGHLNNFSEYLHDLEALRSLAVEKCGQDRILILGHSMGGLIALSYALKSPDSIIAVVVSSPFLGLRVAVPKAKIILGRVLSRVFPSLTMDNQLDPRFLSHDPEVVRAYVEDPLVHRRVSARWFTETTRERESVLTHAPGFSLPLLVLQAGDDRMVDPASSELFYRQAESSSNRLIVYPGFYHEIFNETEKEKALRDLDNWLANLRS